jgi:hypothetical protein
MGMRPSERLPLPLNHLVKKDFYLVSVRKRFFFQASGLFLLSLAAVYYTGS